MGLSDINNSLLGAVKYRLNGQNQKKVWFLFPHQQIANAGGFWLLKIRRLKEFFSLKKRVKFILEKRIEFKSIKR